MEPSASATSAAQHGASVIEPSAFVDAAREKVAKMTLEEKASMCSGSGFWHTQGVPSVGVPAVAVSDGPHGLRKLEDDGNNENGMGAGATATCFPTASALAASWDRSLMHEIGRALGREASAQGVTVLLGPGVNLKRNPRCGRNFEYFSEDPLLTGQLASAFVKGVQGEGVGTSLKHLAANNQETNRMGIDTVVDERTLRELYLPAFEAVVRTSQPWTVM